MKVIDMLRVMPKWEKVRIIPSDSDKWEYGVNYNTVCTVWDVSWSLVNVCGDCEVSSVEVCRLPDDAYLKIEYVL